MATTSAASMPGASTSVAFMSAANVPIPQARGGYVETIAVRTAYARNRTGCSRANPHRIALGTSKRPLINGGKRHVGVAGTGLRPVSRRPPLTNLGGFQGLLCSLRYRARARPRTRRSRGLRSNTRSKEELRSPNGRRSGAGRCREGVLEHVDLAIDAVTVTTVTRRKTPSVLARHVEPVDLQLVAKQLDHVAEAERTQADAVAGRYVSLGVTPDRVAWIGASTMFRGAALLVFGFKLHGLRHELAPTQSTTRHEDGRRKTPLPSYSR